MANFFDQLIYFLNENKNIHVGSQELDSKILLLTHQKRKSNSVKRQGRTFTVRDQSQSNIVELYDSSVRCHICNGIVNLKFGGIQYDHVNEYRHTKETDPLNMKPTHPFCNNNRTRIEEYRINKLNIELPRPIQTLSLLDDQRSNQLSFWGPETDFPL
jgi:hypothetical protein